MKRILFITKNFPPQTGGMEQYCRDLYHHLKKRYDVFLIPNRKGKKFLPIFGIIAIFKGFYYAAKSDIIYIGDGSLSWIGYILGKLLSKKIYITVHGLDITWNKKLYQWVIPKIISTFDGIVCVSEFTRQECIQRGIDKEKITIIPNGINFENIVKADENIDKQSLLTQLGIKNGEGKKILFSIGRWRERKGIQWFIENVYPTLTKNKYIYIIAGYGEYGKIYKKLIDNMKLTDIYIVGRVSGKEKVDLFSLSDLFIMPNIRVKGDMEGFGITLIEAGFYGLPCIASKIEGITGAIIDGKTGILLDYNEGRENKWAEAIESFDYDKFKKKIIISEVSIHYSWDVISKKYFNLLK